MIKSEVTVLFGRSSVEKSIALCDAIKQSLKGIKLRYLMSEAAREISLISNPLDKVAYCQSLDIDIQHALIISMLEL